MDRVEPGGPYCILGSTRIRFSPLVQVEYKWQAEIADFMISLTLLIPRDSIDSIDSSRINGVNEITWNQQSQLNQWSQITDTTGFIRDGRVRVLTRTRLESHFVKDSDSRIEWRWVNCLTQVIHPKQFSFSFVKKLHFIRLNFQPNRIYCIRIIFWTAFLPAYSYGRKR
jgi:hypothetical protein